MADLAFPFLEDVERRVLQLVQQPRGQSGQPTWFPEEREQAYNDTYSDLYEAISTMDRNYQSEFTDVIIPANTVEYALPARTSFLRGAMILDSGGRQRWFVRTAILEDIGTAPYEQRALLRPDRNSITFTTPTTGTLTARLYYGVYYIPLLHGCARSGGGTTIQLADYSSVEDSLYNGLVIKIIEGTGIGQERTIPAYNGTLRTATVSLAWVTPPDNTSRYTSRPDLPWLAKNAFVNRSVAYLYKKTDESLANKFFALAVNDLGPLKAKVKEQERREPDQTWDQNLYGGWSDPGDSYIY